MINFHALLDNQRFVLGSTLSIDPVGVSAQEPASVSGRPAGACLVGRRERPDARAIRCWGAQGVQKGGGQKGRQKG